MPAAKAPAMTTRQAKRLNRKQTAQFEFTASQLRRADRQEEVEIREKKKQEKEQRRVLNKRKREEQEEKQRAIKRRMLQEGKISIEDTWGRVTRSQSRLHSYFTAPAEQAVERPNATSTVVAATSEDKADIPATTLVDAAEDNANQQCGPCDSKSQRLRDNPPRSESWMGSPDHGNATLDCHRPTPTVAAHSTHSHWLRPRSRQTSSSFKSTQTSAPCPASSSVSRRGTSPQLADAKEEEELLLLMDKFEGDIIVAEDATAEIPSGQPVEEDLATGSFRSVLSEMTVANVNTRAQEKPDTTSVPEGSGLATPSKPRDPFAEFNSGDFDQEDDDDYIEKDSKGNDQLIWDKENTDPLHIYSSAKATPKAAAKLAITDGDNKSEAGPSSCRKRLVASQQLLHPLLSSPSKKLDGFEDIFDEDFDTGGENDIDDDDDDDDYFADDGIDDATLMTLSTQRPSTTDRIVDLNGSPRRLTASRDALVKPSPLTYINGKLMPLQSPRTSAAAAAATPPRTCKKQTTAPAPAPAAAAASNANANANAANTPPRLRRHPGLAPGGSRYAPESLSFNSVCDDELLGIVEQVEEELLSQAKKTKMKGPATCFSSSSSAAADSGSGGGGGTLKGKEREILRRPMLPPPPKTTTTTTTDMALPPLATQHYLMLMAEDDIDSDGVF